jgi:hypothetical protein
VQADVAEEAEVRPGVEVVPAGPGRARGAEGGVVRRRVDDRRDDRGADDPDEQVAAEADRPQDEREDEAENQTKIGQVVKLPSCTGVPLLGTDAMIPEL